MERFWFIDFIHSRGEGKPAVLLLTFSIQNASTLGKLRGTYHYTAPEVYFGQKYTTKSDVYSIGVILWEILYRTMCGKYLQPYADQKHLTFDFQIIIQTAKKGLRPSFPPNAPENWLSVISVCWDADPGKRPECPLLLEVFSYVLKHWHTLSKLKARRLLQNWAKSMKQTRNNGTRSELTTLNRAGSSGGWNRRCWGSDH